jgi:hypothetical protein
MVRVSRPAHLLFVLLFITALVVPSSAQSAGQNVNMVSGTDWTTGDPFLQRQNEPSLAVSTRNAAHLVSAANDYRSVDLPGLLGIEERGDAWMGIFKSFDSGQTWASALLPGYPLDSSPQGLASPIHGLQAVADPVVRAGTNGLFYVSGIAFNRGTNAPSAVFITRFIDNNNRENGDPTAKVNGAVTNVAPTDAIRYLSTKVIDSGTSGQFIDKPWLAVDVPRGTATCTIPFTNPDGSAGTETIPAGAVFLTYTVFTGSTSTKINFVRSADCGVTWSTPIKLSEANSLNQGTVIAIDPSPSSTSPTSSSSGNTYGAAATIYVAWRRFATSSSTDAIMVAKSTDGGKIFGKAVAAVSFPQACSTTPTLTGCAFDQGLSTPNPYGGSFRTNGYPSITVDDTGRVYLAWAQRDVNGDARIMMNVSADGASWTSAAKAIDSSSVLDDNGSPFTNLSGRGHQIMPTLTFNAGKLMLAYYDLRQDHTVGMFSANADFTQYSETRQFHAELCDPAINKTTAKENACSTGIIDPTSKLFLSVFNSYITDTVPPLPGQPLTVRRHTIDLQGAQASPATPGILVIPSFSTFRISHYLFGVTDPSTATQAEQLQTNPPNLPIFVQGTQPFLGDYIDVAGAPDFVLLNGKWNFNTAPTTSPVFHTAWTDNRDVRPPSDGNWQNYAPPFSASNPSAPHPSVFDPTQTVPACTDENHAGMRNQNIYSSRVAPGLVVTSPGNAKLLGVLPSNTSLLFQRAYAIVIQNTSDTDKNFRITVLAQPPDAPTGQASVLQFALQTTLDVTVGAHLSASRPIFVKSAVTTASTPVQVAEIDAIGGPLTTGGLQSSITLNPDPTTPTIIDPANPAIGNPAIGNLEVYNPAIGNPAIGNPAIGNPAIGNPAIGNPAIGNPAIGNAALFNPAIGNPAIGNPAIGNPAIGNPAIGNPAIGNTTLTEANYTVTNVGNTSSSYAVKLTGSQPANIALQLIVSKLYATPTQQNCQTVNNVQTVVVANVNNPVFATAQDLANPDLNDPRLSNATVALAPNENAQITIRATVTSQADLQNEVLSTVAPVVTAHAVNTQDAVNGITTPPATLVITSTGTLPQGFRGTAYTTAIGTFGGFTPYHFLSSPVAPAPGLTLDATTGLISGTPTQSGTFTFTVTVTDSATPTPNTFVRTFTLVIAEPLTITTPALPNAVVGVPYSFTVTSTGGTGTVHWSAAGLPANLSIDPSSGKITGTPTTANPTGFTVVITATDSGTPPHTASATFTLRVLSSSLAITTMTLPRATVKLAYKATLAATGGVMPYTWSLAPGSGPLPPGLTLSTSGVISGTPKSFGFFKFTVRVTDSETPPQTATQPLSILVCTSYDKDECIDF